MAKYMYKPMGNGKYASILYVESVYQDNKKRGWLLEIPEQFKTEPVVVKTDPNVRGQNFGQKGVRKKN